MLSRVKSILGLTAASFIDKNWNQSINQWEQEQIDED